MKIKVANQKKIEKIAFLFFIANSKLCFAI